MSAALKLVTTSNFLSLPSSYDGIIYGPFESGPFKNQLGLNILGTGEKACSFNCVYCDLGATDVRLNKMKSDVPFAPIDQLTLAINKAFESIHAKGPGIDGIWVSGNGEPTLHPQFAEIMQLVVAARNIWLPGKPIRVMTNGALLDSRKIADAMNLVDQRVVKIDAGSERLFKAINLPLSRTNLAKVLAGVKRLKSVTVQSLFFEGDMTNTKASDIDDWIEVLAMIKPASVEISGLSRPPAHGGLKRCEEDTLYAIASRLERKIQIRAIVIP